MNTTTTAQSESATDEEEPSAGLSSAGLSSSGLSSSEDSESSLGLQREIWNRGLASSDEEEDEPALQSTATSDVATASGAVATTHFPDLLLCDICQQVCALYKCCIPHLSP